MILNMVCGGGAGGDIDKSQIIVTAESGSTVTCTKGTDVRTASESSGTWRFTGIDNGTWTVTALKEGKSASKEVVIDKLSIVYLELIYRKVPEFTYTGDYALVNDDNTQLTDFLSDNWKLRLLSSGILTFQRIGTPIDIFGVGGGGGGGLYGGGGGYTKTVGNQTVNPGQSYSITVGAGGPADGGNGSRGGTSSFANMLSAGGGYAGYSDGSRGGDGGSGGGSYGGGGVSGSGGSNGGNGGGGQPGKGQGTTTKEFGEGNGILYAGGGGGGGLGTGNNGYGGSGGGGQGAFRGSTRASATAGTANTGGGGGGGNTEGQGSKPGGSGIIVIRNHR